MSSNRDYTKYMFEGKKLGKAPLVRALVKQYLHDHRLCSFEELLSAFPDKLQADNPMQFDKVRCVVRRLPDIPEASLKHFSRKEPIQLGRDVVLVSREWNVYNIQNVLAHVKTLGYVVTCA